MKRKKNEVEKLAKTGRTIHCKSCGEAGHNALECQTFPKEKVPRKRKSKSDGHDEVCFCLKVYVFIPCLFSSFLTSTYLLSLKKKS